MARQPRLYLPGSPQHIVQRGNNREACFYDEADYKAYLSFLKEVSLKYRVAIHAFVLMTNHVHLLVTPSGETAVSRFNAMGKATELLTPHDEYKALGKTPETCQQAYRGLFRGRMAEKDLVEIGDSVNSGWVLGDDRFKQQIEKKTGRQASPARRGGDRKSEKYRESKYQCL